MKASGLRFGAGARRLERHTPNRVDYENEQTRLVRACANLRSAQIFR